MVKIDFSSTWRYVNSQNTAFSIKNTHFIDTI